MIFGIMLIFGAFLLMSISWLFFISTGKTSLTSFEEGFPLGLIIATIAFILFTIMGATYIYRAGSFILELDKNSKSIKVEQKESLLSAVESIEEDLKKLSHIEARSIPKPIWHLKKGYSIEVSFKMNDNELLKVNYLPFPFLGFDHEKAKIKKIADFAGVEAYWIQPKKFNAFVKATYIGSGSLIENELEKIKLE